jgi:regulator of protease activity HflC (stomatin/prohibitin superfamily)
MGAWTMTRELLAIVMLLGCCAGCGGAMIEPGHRGLLFDPAQGGLQRQVLGPGYHRVGLSGHIEDFDVTYSTRRETLHTITREGLAIDAGVAIIYRPIVSELYELDTEIGRNYYEEVVGPEMRSAARGVLARHSYADLPKTNEKIEDEIERDLRARINGRHVEISSVVLESIQIPPEVAAAFRDREAAEQNARRRKIELEAEALREKLESEKAWEREKLELERNVERKRLQRAAEGR